MVNNFEDLLTLCDKYDIAGPRYTSYPTALEMNDSKAREDRSALIASRPEQPIALYVHIPFCHKLCYYCGCNKIVSNDQFKAERYVDALIKELQQLGDSISGRKLRSLHLGGGTPSFLTSSQIARLMTAIECSFSKSQVFEASIEIDSRSIEVDYINLLCDLGFSRLSIGIQDTDESVQNAINRIQSSEHIGDLVRRAKSLGFKSINADLIYGLPRQSLVTFKKTVDDVVQFGFDRVSLFSYAHLPRRFKAQRLIATDELPVGHDKLKLMLSAQRWLAQAGYREVGMDHFALPSDELAQAVESGSLNRNFQGYTADPDIDLLAIGVSSISDINGAVLQNDKALKDYYASIDGGLSPVAVGFDRLPEDLLRGWVIKALMCQFKVDKRQFALAYGVSFDRYFASEIEQLSDLMGDGLVANDETELRVTHRGLLFVRRVAMAFDTYLSAKRQPAFSKVV
jgi:oxygen-independent coproporphyrinogen-3 oxidase